MGFEVITNAKILVDGYDYSGDLNAVAMDGSAVALDATTFGSGGWMQRAGGLRDVSFQAEGFIDPSGPTVPGGDAWGNLGGGAAVATIGPQTGAEGELAFSFPPLQSKWGMAGKVGDLLKFTGLLEGAGGYFVGTILANKTGVVAGGNGTGFNLGAVGSGQKLYAALHVLAYTGSGSLTVSIQSDNGSGFPSPATQITFAAASAVGGQYAAPVAGPIAGETWWRASWTFTGTSVAFFVNVGIQ